MKTALLLIATGAKYHKYVEPLLKSADEFFISHTPFLWTNSRTKFVNQQFELEDKGHPNTTLYRYHTFYRHADILLGYDQLFYCDIDMLFASPIDEVEIFSQGITATLHPGFVSARWDRNGDYISTRGTPERNNRESMAYLPHKADNKYFCGGFNGGDARAYLAMADTIRQNIDRDKLNFGLEYAPIWHDESYLNNYLYYNPPARILTPSFCFPEDYDGGYGWKAEQYPAKLIALDKRKAR